MPATRKLVRDTIRTALADPTYGFNARLAAIASTYGIDAFPIDWTAANSDNFIQSYLDGSGKDLSRLTGIKCALYTSGAQTLRSEERSKSAKFHGEVQAHLDVWVSFSDGEDVTDDLTEPYADAIEDAVVEVLNPRSPLNHMWSGSDGLLFDGAMTSIRNPVEQTDSGYEQYLSFTFIFEVMI